MGNKIDKRKTPLEVKPFYSKKFGWRLCNRESKTITYIPKGSHAEKFLETLREGR